MIEKKKKKLPGWVVPSCLALKLGALRFCVFVFTKIRCVREGMYWETQEARQESPGSKGAPAPFPKHLGPVLAAKQRQEKQIRPQLDAAKRQWDFRAGGPGRSL
jgi:hypothetical protein